MVYLDFFPPSLKEREKSPSAFEKSWVFSKKGGGMMPRECFEWLQTGAVMPSYFARVGQIMSTVTWKDYANWNDYRLEFKMRLGDPFLNFFWGAHCILKVGLHIPIFLFFNVAFYSVAASVYFYPHLYFW